MLSPMFGCFLWLPTSSEGEWEEEALLIAFVLVYYV